MYSRTLVLVKRGFFLFGYLQKSEAFKLIWPDQLRSGFGTGQAANGQSVSEKHACYHRAVLTHARFFAVANCRAEDER